MSEPVSLLIHGANGRMGRALSRLCNEQPGCAVTVAVSRGQPSQRVVDGVAHFAASEMSGAPAFDVMVDFSLPEAFDAALALALERRAALVSGTTGLSEVQKAALEAASRTIPVLWASNFSIGVALLHELARRAAAALPGWDCDIIEMHHTRKLDAPSGTALTLGRAVGEGGGEARYAAIRAGDIVGEHCVQFAGPGERVELVHRATNRDIFARGALRAAAWLHGRAPGLYAVADMLNAGSGLDSPAHPR
ncbi:4-hydroxy-tetrahydrodipicolinate reductase [Lysobacter pythonis]|uniref:4-hydroxy-tetrahydrodipicolinate reductase n=1 Tax=Solilutibacter pythonis TaxID=2483112 RepID=A0A3M2HYE8_9GAMM|nr:4-hydroxy-tetrahydrodipicolinate reductase [Lysobacter pythonis]RMH94746.1 4-hydroxy-tetrahydrodipicolinate reductase [Lysobacter pythonis]